MCVGVLKKSCRALLSLGVSPRKGFLLENSCSKRVNNDERNEYEHFLTGIKIKLEIQKLKCKFKKNIFKTRYVLTFTWRHKQKFSLFKWHK